MSMPWRRCTPYFATPMNCHPNALNGGEVINSSKNGKRGTGPPATTWQALKIYKLSASVSFLQIKIDVLVNYDACACMHDALVMRIQGHRRRFGISRRSRLVSICIVLTWILLTAIILCQLMTWTFFWIKSKLHSSKHEDYLAQRGLSSEVCDRYTDRYTCQSSVNLYELHGAAS